MFGDAGINCQGDAYVVVFEVKGVGMWQLQGVGLAGTEAVTWSK